MKHIHEHDLVHHNIGLDNVVKDTSSWLLIGRELAGRTKHLVWCEWKLLPDGIKHRIGSYTCKRSVAAWHAYQGSCSLC